MWEGRGRRWEGRGTEEKGSEDPIYELQQFVAADGRQGIVGATVFFVRGCLQMPSSFVQRGKQRRLTVRLPISCNDWLMSWRQ